MKPADCETSATSGRGEALNGPRSVPYGADIRAALRLSCGGAAEEVAAKSAVGELGVSRADCCAILRMLLDIGAAGSRAEESPAPCSAELGDATGAADAA